MAILKRDGVNDQGPAMPQIFPSSYVTSMEYPELAEPQTSDGHECRAIRCRNCNFPMKDYREYPVECPWCETTNFKGEI